jgi:hypothetical protein
MRETRRVCQKRDQTMHHISDFNSLFELAVGINALVVIFDLMPRLDGRWAALIDEYDRLYNAADQAGWDLFAFSPTADLRTEHSKLRKGFVLIALFSTTLAFLYLLRSAFDPQRSIGGLTAGALIVLALVPVPLAYMILFLHPMNHFQERIIPPLQSRLDFNKQNPPPADPKGPPTDHRH